MTDDQLKLVIGSAITLVVGIVGVFKDEILNFFGTRKYKYLKGEWDCEWEENPNKNNPTGKSIKDRVLLTKVFGKIIKGKGSTGDLGNWNINGRISESAITISYNPKRDNIKHNLGVVILQIVYSNKTELKGKWYQFNGIELVGGDTIWKKV
jgi:hypothetical protein